MVAISDPVERTEYERFLVERYIGRPEPRFGYLWDGRKLIKVELEYRDETRAERERTV